MSYAPTYSGFGGGPGYQPVPGPAGAPTAPPSYGQPAEGSYQGEQQYAAGGYNAGYDKVTQPVLVPAPMPQASDKPLITAGYQDVFFGILFWVHALAIFIVAIVYGVPAIKDDASKAENDPSRGTLDVNAALFLRVIALACVVGGVMSAAMMYILQRYAASLIKCSLYTSVAIQAAMTAAMFSVSVIGGGVLCIPLILTLLYLYFIRNRIPFASAHVETAVAAVKSYPSVFLFATVMLFAQAGWAIMWSVAAFGIEHKLNNMSNSTSTSGSSSVALGEGQLQMVEGTQLGAANTLNSSNSGTIAMFVLVLSLYWGAQLCSYITHFVTAGVTGSWWFVGRPEKPVTAAVCRAMTTSFGTLSLGAFIVAFLETAKRSARAAMRKEGRNGNNGAAILLCIATLIIGCVEALVAYLNVWAIIVSALTGAKFTRAGREAFELFKNRGWSAIINDNLVSDALAISCLMVASASAVTGAGVTYLAMPSSNNRSAIAALAAFFCFLVGYAMASIMTGVIASSVRTVFFCFAYNPSALATTHPEHLANLANAWNKYHPQVFSSCGYAATYCSAAPMPGGYQQPMTPGAVAVPVYGAPTPVQPQYGGYQGQGP